MKKVKSIDWVGGTVEFFVEKSGGYRAVITPGIPMPNANEIVEIHAAEQKEQVEVRADSLAAIEDKCQKIIREKEGLEDYVPIHGWRSAYNMSNVQSCRRSEGAGLGKLFNNACAHQRKPEERH